MNNSNSSRGLGASAPPAIALTDILPLPPDQYWRWGIPSLILAVVTILLSALSLFWVGPRIIPNYKSMLKQSMDSLVQDPSVAPKIESPENSTAPSSESMSFGADRSKLLERSDELKRATLIAKRLMFHDPQDPMPKWSLAQLEMASQSNWVALASLSDEVSTSEERVRWMELANAARDRSMSEFKAASLLQGEFADRARLWLIRDQVDRLVALLPAGEIDLESLIQDCQVASFGTELQREARHVRGQIRVMQALAWESPADTDQRRRWLSEAQRELADAEILEESVSMWKAESVAIEEGAEQERIARQGMRSIMSRSARGERLSLLEVDAGFRAMLVVGSLAEATAFATSRLPDFSPDEKQRLRKTVAAGLLRTLVCKAYFGDSTYTRLSASKLFAMAVRVAPDSPSVAQLFSRLIKPMASDSILASAPIVRSVRDAAGTDQADAALSVLLEWLQQRVAGENDEGDGLAPELELLKNDSGLLIGSVPVISQLLTNATIDYPQARAMLSSLLEVNDRTPDLWLSRGLIAMQHGDYDTAIESFRSLEVLGVSNARVQQLLEEAQSRKAAEVSQQAAPSDAVDSDRSF